MAVISLGTLSMVTGANPVTFNPFGYRRNRAYAIKAIMTSSDFNQIFSYIRIIPNVMPNNLVPFLLNDPQQLEIVQMNQLFYFAGSSLFERNGDVEFLAQRLPRWRSAGDATPVTLELTYDDELFVPSWR